MIGVPAVEIRHHRGDRVRELRLAGQSRLGHGGHADHVAPPGSIEIRFGKRGELRPLHREIDAAPGVRNAFLGARLVKRVGEPGTNGMSERHMRDKTAAEETLFARMGAVDELIRHDERAGRQSLAQRTTGRNGNDVGGAGALQRVDIGAVVDRCRRMDMAAAVARQEQHVHAFQPAREQ